MLFRLARLAPFLITTLLAAQSAHVAGYGTGCGTTIGWTGLPRLGQTFTFVYSGPNQNIEFHGVLGQIRPVFLLGASDRQLGGLPLPWPLPLTMTNGVPGCALLQSSDVFTPMRLETIARFEERVAIAIPNNAALLGGVFFAQWLTWHRYRQAPNLPLTEWVQLSDAARATIGT